MEKNAGTTQTKKIFKCDVGHHILVQLLCIQEAKYRTVHLSGGLANKYAAKYLKWVTLQPNRC